MYKRYWLITINTNGFATKALVYGTETEMQEYMTSECGYVPAYRGATEPSQRSPRRRSRLYSPTQWTGTTYTTPLCACLSATAGALSWNVCGDAGRRHGSGTRHSGARFPPTGRTERHKPQGCFSCPKAKIYLVTISHRAAEPNSLWVQRFFSFHSVTESHISTHRRSSAGLSTKCVTI